MMRLGVLASEDRTMHQLHIIVARARHGWGVSVNSDQVSLHKHLDDARTNAIELGNAAERLGESAVIVDLSEDEID
jgi:hypothetical protein